MDADERWAEPFWWLYVRCDESAWACEMVAKAAARSGDLRLLQGAEEGQPAQASVDGVTWATSSESRVRWAHLLGADMYACSGTIGRNEGT